MISALACVGLGLSIYSLAHHEGFVSGTFCTINQTFNCDIVNRGPFSELFGIPVALLGILGYGFMAAAALLQWKRPEDKGSLLFLVLAVVGGLGFSLYLSGIEAFVLRTWCIVCLSSQTAMLGIFFATMAMLVQIRRKPPTPETPSEKKDTPTPSAA